MQSKSIDCFLYDATLAFNELMNGQLLEKPSAYFLAEKSLRSAAEKWLPKKNIVKKLYFLMQ